jgi:ActR/RegA family two-component response regulator
MADMADETPNGLRDRRLLIVEDDYTIAVELMRSLEALGVEVIGPVASVEDALALVEREGGRMDGAVLDINLRGRRVYPVAEALTARGVPFVFATGYDAMVIPGDYAGVPRCEKPVDKELLARMLARAR